jgi:hypothetical protein
MIIATSTFIEAVYKWVSALQSGDFAEARLTADFVKAKGDMLAIRPEFRRCFVHRCPDRRAEDVLHDLVQFMACATECWERAVRQAHAERAAHRLGHNQDTPSD